VDIVQAESMEDIRSAAHLFDNAIDERSLARFVSQPNHRLLLARHDSRTVGFVSIVELTHPDKGVEWFLYELAVDEAFQRRGIGRALVEAATELAKDVGAYGVFTVAEIDNDAALATYRSAGGDGPQPAVVFDWTTG
jgi:ribosomal protein S18 acetylase RimI-like enzyme